MDARQLTAAFCAGDLGIMDYRRLYDENPEIDAFLQGIVDDIKAKGGEIVPCPMEDPLQPGTTLQLLGGVNYLLAPQTDPSLEYCPPQFESVRQMLNYEFRSISHNVRTAEGALTFFEQVVVIYYQVDRNIKPTGRYWIEWQFAQDVIPECLIGGVAEMYIQEHIIPLFPDTMKKAERKKEIKARIREEFRTEKGYPQWAQASDWPLGSDGKPATYIGKGKCQGDLQRWRFRDESSGEIITVEQCF